MPPKQITAQIRSLLRYAGARVRVKLTWIASHLKVSVEEVTAALGTIETERFRVMRFPGVAASVELA